MRLRERIVAQFVDRRLDLVRTTAEISEYLGADGSEPQARRERLRRLTGQTIELLRQRLREACRDGEDADRLLAALDRCLEVESQIDRNANQNLMVEAWIADLALLG
jgi:hypothetical protein